MQEESIRKDRHSQFKIYIGAKVHYSSGSKTIIHMEVEIMSEVGGRKKSFRVTDLVSFNGQEKQIVIIKMFFFPMHRKKIYFFVL